MIDGCQPGQDGFALTPGNRPAVQAWLKAEGIAPARVDGMRDDTLFKAYRWPAYLKQMKTRADYYPSCAKPKDDKPCSTETTTTAMPNAAKPPTGTSAIGELSSQSVPPAVPACTIAPGTLITPTTGSANTSSVPSSQNPNPSPDPATLLAQLFLTEARVVELIREHAPAIIAELLNVNRNS